MRSRVPSDNTLLNFAAVSATSTLCCKDESNFTTSLLRNPVGSIEDMKQSSSGFMLGRYAFS